jgi:hypothetical protein
MLIQLEKFCFIYNNKNESPTPTPNHVHHLPMECVLFDYEVFHIQTTLLGSYPLAVMSSPSVELYKLENVVFLPACFGKF